MPSARPKIAIDVLVEAGDWPPKRELQSLVAKAVVSAIADIEIAVEAASELSIVFSDDAHVTKLNAEWRGKDMPTNVLSFPAFPGAVAGEIPPMLGDIVLAAETVELEARLEGKPLDHHISHLVIHGLLHLLGYDHLDDQQAEAMEGLERTALARLAIPDPYA